MSTPIRQLLPTVDPTRHWLFTDDGSRTLWDSQLDETFHSGCGAISESLAVYSENSRVAERLQSGNPTNVVEYGFGTGTSFLLTAAFAQSAQVPLTYVALEHNLLPVEIISGLELNTALQTLLNRAEWRHRLPHDFPSALEEVQCAWEHAHSQIGHENVGRIPPLFLTNFVTLELFLGDARCFSGKDQTAAKTKEFHAIYFDAFAPDKDPGLWTESVFLKCFEMLAPSGTLTSYCVKSSVRNLLQLVGFELEKLPGPPGGKREVLRATKPSIDSMYIN